MLVPRWSFCHQTKHHPVKNTGKDLRRLGVRANTTTLRWILGSQASRFLELQNSLIATKKASFQSIRQVYKSEGPSMQRVTLALLHITYSWILNFKGDLFECICFTWILYNQKTSGPSITTLYLIHDTHQKRLLHVILVPWVGETDLVHVGSLRKSNTLY